MKHLRYYSEFRDVNGALIRAEILQESAQGYIAQEVELSADNTLSITWNSIAKEDPIQSSSVTITLASNTDRQFIDLYHVAVADVRLDLYRDGKIYWSGVMDTELYEEPFSYEKDYDVTLTFTDFGCLDRKKWNNRQLLMSIREVINTCLNYKYTEVIEHITTSRAGVQSTELLDRDSVATANFYDEEENPMSCREVLEAILKPYDLHINQKNGRIYIWDWNALSELETKEIIWASDDAVLSVDKVYNNIKLTFSPYEDTDIIDVSVDPDKVGTGNTYSIQCDYEEKDGTWASPKGFDIVLSDTADGSISKSNIVKFFKILPTFSGDKCAGIAHTFMYRNTPKGDYNVIIDNTTSTFLGPFSIFSPTRQKYIQSTNNSKQLIRLNVDMMCDVRYNPYEQAEINNEKGDYARLQKYANVVSIPFLLTLRDGQGTALYHYENKNIYNSIELSNNKGWVAGEGYLPDSAYLCWYDKNDRNKSTGVGGWQTNKQCIGCFYKKSLPTSYHKMPDGEYIPLPPTSGYLELKIHPHLLIYGSDMSIYKKIRWVLFKDIHAELVDEYGQSIERNDVEYSAWLNKDAKEELTIDTVVGTLPEESLVARGLIFDTSTKKVVNKYTRAGHTDLLEKLLIGTLYSQYATRHNTLSGTVELIPEFCVLSDKNIEGKYIITEEVQDLYLATSQIKITEVSKDEYQGIEYINE
jgi:hypothetical protein